jgi:hypothetical protein
MPARFVQMLQSPDELHVVLKISNEKSACRKKSTRETLILDELRTTGNLEMGPC